MEVKRLFPTPHPQKPNTTEFMLVSHLLTGTLLDKIGLLWGERDGQGLEDTGGVVIAKTNAYLLFAALSGVKEQDSNQFEEEDGRESCLLSRACGAERTAPCVRLDWELLSEGRPAGGLLAAVCPLARSLARSRPLPPGSRLPHHLSSGTTCCFFFSCMATTTAWDKMVFSRKWEGFWPIKKRKKGELIGTVLLYKQSLSL